MPFSDPDFGISGQLGGLALTLAETAVEHSGLYVTDIEILRRHYALTLSEWRRRFETSRDRYFQPSGTDGLSDAVGENTGRRPHYADYMGEAEKPMHAAAVGGGVPFEHPPLMPGSSPPISPA